MERTMITVDAVVASFPGHEAAEAARARLETAGVDPEDVRLLGGAADASRGAPTRGGAWGFRGRWARSPRHPTAWDSYLREHDGEVCLAVDLRDPRRAVTLPEVLLEEGATSVERLPRPTGRRV